MAWMLMAVTWAWDSAELLHRSARWSDSAGHATLLAASAGLFTFNAFVEIPHFFKHGQDSAAAQAGASMLQCFQDAESPIWLKRVPFFAAYFFGCSWCSAAMSYRYFVCGGWRHKGKARAPQSVSSTHLRHQPAWTKGKAARKILAVV